MHTEDKEPDGTAAGQTRNASQQSKHFQCGSATVLCTTVNSEACLPLGNVERLLPRKPGRPADGPRTNREVGLCQPWRGQPLFLENAPRAAFECAAALTCINSVNRIRRETGPPSGRPPSKNLKPRRCPCQTMSSSSAPPAPRLAVLTARSPPHRPTISAPSQSRPRWNPPASSRPASPRRSWVKSSPRR